jgi:hypothetical protein
MPGEFVDRLPEDALLRPARWPAGCGALMTTRAGGVSTGANATLNLKARPEDEEDAIAVLQNRRRFAATLAAAPAWLEQVHGIEVVHVGRGHVARGSPPPRADASVTTEPGVACTVLVADCLPVLFATRDGRAVCAAHAGWRGLSSGVLEATVRCLCAAAGALPGDVVAWLGACIGFGRFEVGDDVREAFAGDGEGAFRFLPDASARDGRPKWLADLRMLAGARLERAGVRDIGGSDLCTASDASRFFSYRRDGPGGRMAAAAWIDAL